MPRNVLLPVSRDEFPIDDDQSNTEYPEFMESRRTNYLSLPHFYHSAYIISYAEFHGNYEVPTVETNLHLAAKTGNLHCVRALNIEAQHSTETPNDLRGIINVLKPYSGQLSGIVKLVLYFHFEEYCFDSREHEVSIRHAVGRNAQDFVRMLPSIRYIDISGIPDGQFADVFYSALLKAYSGQLCRLFQSTSMSILLPVVLSQITHMNVSLDEEKCLISVCPNTIQKLRIEDLPRSHTWSLFGCNKASTNVLLPSITEIDIRYADNDLNKSQISVENAKQRKLYAPMLTTLKLCGKTELPLLYSIGFPDAMECIEIEADQLAISKLEPFILPATQRLKLKVIDGGSPSSEIHTTLNAIFNSARGSLEASLEVPYTLHANNINLIHCLSLTTLQIHCKVDAAALIKLIARHPALRMLLVTQLIADDALPPFLPQPDSGYRLQPIHATLKCLMLRCGSTIFSHGMYCAIVKHLLLRLPTVAKVYTERVFWNQWQCFVAENWQLYPHLAGIALE